MAAALIGWSGLAIAGTANDPPVFRSSSNQFTLLQPLRRAPLTPIETADGGQVDLGELRGKVVLVNFWATWCAPCLRELPSLDRLQAALGDDRIEVMAVALDEAGLAVVAPYFDRLGLKNLDIYLDPTGALGSFEGAGASFDGFRLYALPISYVVDHEGIIVGYFPGPAEWDSEAAQALLSYYADQVHR